jgi:3-oxoacyl-[acyl-carrier protein] reductase
MRLGQKVAIVTGGGRGIGEAYCKGLAREGAKVAVVDIDPKAAEMVASNLKKDGHEALSLKVDVSSERDTLDMAERVSEALGGIDILVNNAGIFPLCKFTDLTLEQWHRVLGVNLDGPFLCSKAVVPYMIRKGKGKIINVSTECFFMGYGELVDYTAAKSGVVGLTRALAEALGEHGINVNTITPGLTATQILLKEQPYNFDPHVQRQCIKRRQQPEDLVGTVVFLASGESDMITGQIINVDGGFNKH